MPTVKVWITTQTQRFCIAPTKRLLQKQFLKHMELTCCKAILRILKHKFATPVSTFLFYSHTRELVFDCFQSQDFQILFALAYLFSISVFLHIITSPIPKIPDSPLWLCKGERRACILTKLSDQWHVLISSALVSLSCLFKQWPFPPTICLIPTVP